MPITDTKVIPLASLRVYDAGEGDPVETDPGHRWYDPLLVTGHLGTYSRASNGMAKLELLPGVGLTCRPVFTAKDTRIAHYAASGGTWEERRPAVGIRNIRVCQVDASADTAWTLTSDFSLPGDPHFAFTLKLAQVNPDNDWTDYPPYARVEFGDWAVELHREQGTRLMRKVASVWQVAEDLPAPQVWEASGEYLFAVRFLRGRILISVDVGRTWIVYTLPDGTEITQEATPIVLRGQGQMVAFGLHQLFYQEGTYTGPVRNTFHNRVTPVPSPTLAYRGSAPTYTSVTLEDVTPTSTSSALMQYRLTLTPGEAQAGWPFSFYRSPTVYAVRFEYPAVRTAGSGAYTTPWDGEILSLDIEKPAELDGASATVRIEKDADTQFTGNYRWRKATLNR